MVDLTRQAPTTGAYRRDIDGLRAVAVMSVIAYHLNTVLIPGGFVGVDVFFVISGFVVTGSVLRAESGSVLRDLVRFWRRRLLRILPALMACVIVSLALFLMFFSPAYTAADRATGRTGIAALFGLGNVYLHRLNLNYFQADNSINLFTHTWSLGVEEQFYVCFSIVSIVVVPLVVGSHYRVARTTLFVGITAISFLAFLYRSETNPLANYYFLTSRLWELGVGCLLAVWLAPPRRLPPSMVRAATQLIAVICLAWALFAPHSEIEFPTLQIIAACLATASLIAVGEGTSEPISRVLSGRAAVGIGLISYSLYLWHWPILVIFRSTVGLKSMATVSLALCVVAVVAYASYRFVETKWRQSTQPVLALGVRFAAGVVLAVALAAWGETRPGVFYLGKRRDWAAELMPPVDSSYTPDGRITQRNCVLLHTSTLPASIPKACTSPGADGRDLRRLILVGDSHALADWGMASYATAAGGYRLSTMPLNGCSPRRAGFETLQYCVNYWSWAARLARRELQRDDVVFVVFHWAYRSDSPFESALRILKPIIKAAESAGADVLIQAPIPKFERTALTCSKEWFRTDYSGCTLDRNTFVQQRARAMAFLAKLRAEHPRLRVWDPIDQLCRNQCVEFDGNKPVFRDEHHLSYHGSRLLGPTFLQFLTNR